MKMVKIRYPHLWENWFSTNIDDAMKVQHTYNAFRLAKYCKIIVDDKYCKLTSKKQFSFEDGLIKEIHKFKTFEECFNKFNKFEVFMQELESDAKQIKFDIDDCLELYETKMKVLNAKKLVFDVNDEIIKHDIDKNIFKELDLDLDTFVDLSAGEISNIYDRYCVLVCNSETECGPDIVFISELLRLRHLAEVLRHKAKPKHDVLKTSHLASPIRDEIIKYLL